MSTGRPSPYGRKRTSGSGFLKSKAVADYEPAVEFEPQYRTVHVQVAARFAMSPPDLG
jgi:hypothetical protein